MIVYKFRDEQGRYIEINFCETGLYVEIDDCDGSDHMTAQNIIIDDDGIESLKKFLNGGVD
jgi:hypothetical protein